MVGMSTEEPETWMGNVLSAAEKRETERLKATIGRASCLGCGLPLPHAGECKREAK